MFQVNGLNYNSVKMKIRFVWQRVLWKKQQKRTRWRYINLCICINHYYFIVILTHPRRRSRRRRLPPALHKSFKFVFILHKISNI